MNMDDNELERLAVGVHEEWDSPSLWPRIRAELIAERPERRPAQFWLFAFAGAAAILVLTVALARLMPQPVGPSADPDFLTREALREVERSEAAYAQSIDRLAAIARPSLETSSTPLAAAYREKLVLLDAAIEDLKTNMNGNLYNAYLRNQLASLYRDKQSTLEEWLKNAKNN